MALEDLYKWEEMSLSQIIEIMVKWFNYTEVEHKVAGRHSVESGVWHDVAISKNTTMESRIWINGQRIPIVKARLIAFLDRENNRPKEFIPKPEKS